MDLSTSSKNFFLRDMEDLVNDDSIHGSQPISEVFKLSTRILLIVLTVAVIVLGLGGNGFVLWASTKCRAITLNRVSLALLENLALCDMLITVSFYSPMLLTLSSDGWMLGRTACFLAAFIGDIPLALEGFIIAGISCHKLYILTHCLQPVRCTRKQMIKVLALFWFISTAVVLLFSFYVTRGMAIYVPYAMTCIEIAGSYFSFVFGNVIVLVLPLLLIVVSNIWTLIIVIKRTRQNMGKFLPNSSAITTVSLICWTHIFSYLPVFLVPFIGNMSMVTVSSFALSANVIANPFIYTMSYKSFREVVVQCLVQGSAFFRTKPSAANVNRNIKKTNSNQFRMTNICYSTAL
ncbi:hypothetical protein ACHWQZ_G017390 [Mnemiopsis leidyi]